MPHNNAIETDALSAGLSLFPLTDARRSSRTLAGNMKLFPWSQLSPQQKRNVAKDAVGITMLIVFSPLVLLIWVAYGIGWIWAHLLAWSWAPGPWAVFVYSDSPAWRVFCEEKVIPLLPPGSEPLNWSERHKWHWSIPVFLARFFGSRSTYQPVGLVVARFKRVQVFRFWEGFQELKKGNSLNLEHELQNFLSALKVSAPDGQQVAR